MGKYFYTANSHQLEVYGDKILCSAGEKDVILYNTWCQRGFCQLENGNPIDSYEDAVAAIKVYGYRSATYYTDINAISKTEAARLYLRNVVGEDMDMPISKKDANKVLQKVIK